MSYDHFGELRRLRDMVSFHSNAASPDLRRQIHDTAKKVITGQDRADMLGALAESTKTKNIGGERHFALHRGMGKEEAKYGANHPVSYSASKGTAETFASHYKGKVKSHWVPEKHISLYVDHFVGALERNGEKEVIVDAAHDHPIHKPTPMRKKSEYYDLDGESDIVPFPWQVQKGDLFKDGWVVQGKGANNVATDVGNHAPAKAAKPKAARTKASIVGAKIPGTPSISGVAKGDLFNKDKK